VAAPKENKVRVGDISEDFDDGIFCRSKSKENHSILIENEPSENILKQQKEINMDNNAKSNYYTPHEALLSTRSLTLPRQSGIRQVNPYLQVRK
jgi:hypothetical protein